MRPSMIATVVSMLAVVPAVNTFAEEKPASTPPRQERSHHESDLKDSVKNRESDLAKLARTLMEVGKDISYPNGFAQVVGLDQSAPAKSVAELDGGETRRCQLIYALDDANGNRPICVYLVRAQKTKHDIREQFFRVSLDGKLEKVVTLRNKLDENGKAIAEGRSKFDEDIDSPEIKKIFKTDMAFWVKDWLKKQQKLLAKVDAARVKSDKEEAVMAPASATSATLDKEAAPAETSPQAAQ